MFNHKVRHHPLCICKLCSLAGTLEHKQRNSKFDFRFYSSTLSAADIFHRHSRPKLFSVFWRPNSFYLEKFSIFFSSQTFYLNEGAKTPPCLIGTTNGGKQQRKKKLKIGFFIFIFNSFFFCFGILHAMLRSYCFDSFQVPVFYENKTQTE